MKVGILTYHRSHNYGALLQAIALRYVISHKGNNVSFVDYWPEYHSDMYRVINWTELKKRNFLSKIKNLISVGLRLPNILKRQNSFNKFISKYIRPYCTASKEHYDVIICGSDQIWRKQPSLDYQFNPTYFGAGETNADNYYSYAASMGVIDLNEKDKENLKKWLSKFSVLTVRERNLLEALQSIGINNASQVLDPTLLLDKNAWNEIFPEINRRMIKKKYVLFYDLMPESFERTAIEDFVRQKNLELVILKGSAQNVINRSNEITEAGPIEMLSLINNAEFVFTSSFHGLAFSVLFNIPFIASFHHNAERGKSLLDSVGLSERLIEPKSKSIPKLSPIDYNAVNIRISSLRSKSEDILSLLK